MGVLAALTVGNFVLQACGGGDPAAGNSDGGSGNTGATDASGSGGEAAGGNGATTAIGGSGGASGECATDLACEAKLPPTNPAACAEAKCDLVLKKCNFVAKDKDGDGHAAAQCTAAGSGAIDTGDDCDDDDKTSYPGAWDGPPDPGAGKPDTCDTKDNDCDGSADNQKVGGQSCTCNPSQPPKCNQDEIGVAIPGLDASKDGVGICKLGQSECVNGVVGKCIGAVGPAGAETCNGADDDCDGQMDEGNPGSGTACASAQQGECGPGKTNCQGGKLVCVPNLKPAAEICDGKDNNCDGAVDEGMGQTSCSKGECAKTVPNCLNGQPQVCVPGNPGTEQCDGKDNDCDGTTDEDISPSPCDNGKKGRCKACGSQGACVSGVLQACDAPTGKAPANVFSTSPSTNDCGETTWDLSCDGNVEKEYPSVEGSACSLPSNIATYCASLSQSNCTTHYFTPCGGNSDCGGAVLQVVCTWSGGSCTSAGAGQKSQRCK